MGVTFSLIPHVKFLWLYYAMSTVNSFVSGALDAGGNVLCLDTWQDDDAGPWMNSIHFSFAIGVFIAPLLSMPFLGSLQLTNSTNSTILK